MNVYFFNATLINLLKSCGPPPNGDWSIDGSGGLRSVNPKDVHVLGLDAGTGSWDIVSFVNDEMRVEFSMPTAKVVADPHIIVGTLLRFHDFDLIPLPLGYGFPVTKVQKLTDENIKQITVHPSAHEKSDFEIVLRELQRTNLNAVTIPSVKHLPTVPSWRKINRIDLGTPDKVCVAAWAIRDQANRRSIPFERTSFILVEVGLGFTAVLGVHNGCIVDGVGGTMGPMGLRSMGDVDGEVAALMRKVDKSKVYGGGASTILNRPLAGLSELLQVTESNPIARDLYTRMIEDIARTVAGFRQLCTHYEEVYVSGQGADTPALISDLQRLTTGRLKIRQLGTGGLNVKCGALGAAVIANGLASGKYQPLTSTLKLADAAGSILDHVYTKR